VDRQAGVTRRNRARRLGLALRWPSLSASRPQLHALTGLRFVAALQVVVFHCTPWATWQTPPFVRNVAGSGYVAVSLFFVLSGFILTYAHEATGTPGKNVESLDRKRFYLSRFARIYPAYAFALALVAPFYFVHTFRIDGVATLIGQSVPVATLLQAWLPSAAMAWNPPGWSLSAEAFFYAVFPFVASVIVAARPRKAIVIGVVCYALSFLFPLAYLRIAPDGPILLSHESMAFWLNVLRYNPLVRLPEFVLGIVVARFYLAARETAPNRMVAPVASVLAVALVALVLVNAQRVPYPVLHNGLLAPVFAVLIVSLTAGRGPIAAFLATRPLVALGEASYSLYLLHVPLLIYWIKVTKHLPAELPRAIGPTAFVVFAVGGSLLCHRFVEVPMRERVLRRFSPQRTASVVPSL
jgi:peptidoglycan/LPS O-acetylase OafA/YrhL